MTRTQHDGLRETKKKDQDNMYNAKRSHDFCVKSQITKKIVSVWLNESLNISQVHCITFFIGYSIECKVLIPFIILEMNIVILYF